MISDDILDWQMSTEKGRQFVAELLDICGAGALGGTGNYAQDFYSLGRRSVGEDILRGIRNLEHADGLHLEYTMLKEHKHRKDEEDGRDE